MTALVIAEHDNVSIKGSTLPTLTAALACGGEVHVLIVGHQCALAATAAASISGVARVFVADDTHLAHGLAENLAGQVLAMASGYSHVLAPATAFGKNFMPRVAALLGVDQISEITRVVAPDTFERPIYAGNAVATVQSDDTVKVLTVRGTAFAAAAPGGAAPIASVAAVADFARSAFVSHALATSDRPELTAAKVIVSGGRGMGSGENFALIEALAGRLGAAVGASRAAVDAGYVPNDWQIGQTGKIVAPQLYIAVGISGAIQHLAGMKESKVIVAVNKDPEAPIFAVADYGLVGDLFDIVPQMTAQLA
ncbi:electron transfer flavoprotein subunit alpha/FixB family protein [Janthinobacterium sp. PC23-8]|uniref:electron transfer flavoprotein subunit alpha/FixB family protein n=1 Tax=Janthinobacterium sp. PC23-8 TaxID=2012679 RepID=UPI000B96ED25|nr:FAD-binding protein [Janthinobacterium sp. PC23-8]OYO26313.1 electron transfer flavoprotein subunit alpha [Janthinobacterium sp. PC23-8]